jgi:uncharacterized protein (UPF0333 family)
MLSQKRAQSTLEYIIIFTVIVGAIIYAANNFIKQRVQGMLDHVSSQAETAVKHVDFK